jgi:hypothetical protein
VANWFKSGLALCVFQATIHAEDPALKAGKAEAIGWEVRLADGKVQKIKVLDETLVLDTAYGQLKIPSADVQRIEFGLRYSDVELKRIEQSVLDITAKEARTREQGKDALIELGVKSYPVALRLSKKLPPNPHLVQMLEKLKAAIAEQDQTLRDCDLIITTDGSKYAGKFQRETIQAQMGDQEASLKWTNARVLVNGGSAAIQEKIEIVVLGPNGMFGLMQTHFEQVVGIQVTARVGGSVWGSGPYTADSDLGTAVLHSGILKAGETGVVKIRVKGDVGGYAGSTQNGVTTANWGVFQGCYEILGKRK